MTRTIYLSFTFRMSDKVDAGNGIPCTSLCSLMNLCHGPLPIVTLGEKELTFEPHSTQDLEALGDVGLLWNARCSPECDSPECTGSKSLRPHNPAPEAPQPQPCQPDAERIRNLKPRLDPQPLTRSQANRLEKPLLTKTPLALGKEDPGGQPWLTNQEESAWRRPALGKEDGTLGKGKDGGGEE